MNSLFSFATLCTYLGLYAYSKITILVWIGTTRGRFSLSVREEADEIKTNSQMLHQDV